MSLGALFIYHYQHHYHYRCGQLVVQSRFEFKTAFSSDIHADAIGDTESVDVEGIV